MAVYRPASGPTPEAMASAMESGYNGNHDARHDVFRKLLLEFFFAAVLDNAE